MFNLISAAQAATTSPASLEAVANYDTSTLMQFQQQLQSQGSLQNPPINLFQAWLVIGIMFIWFVVVVINLFNVYHWGKSEDKELEEKKIFKFKSGRLFWFISLIVVPQAAILVAFFMVDLFKLIILAISYIYWAVAVLYYFFAFKVYKKRK